jgi:hypothetical protein
MDTQPAPPALHALAYVHQLLATGLTLAKLVDDLIEAIVDHGSDAEDATATIIDMVAGTVGVHLRRVPPADFGRATQLMELTMEAVLADLRMATELAGRRERRHGSPAPPT